MLEMGKEVGGCSWPLRSLKMRMLSAFAHACSCSRVRRG